MSKCFVEKMSCLVFFWLQDPKKHNEVWLCNREDKYRSGFYAAQPKDENPKQPRKRECAVIDKHVIVLAVDLLVSIGPSFGFGFIVFLLATDMLIEALII